MATMPHLVLRVDTSALDVPIAKASADVLALRIDTLGVDRRRYSGTAGELLLQRMVPDPYALEMDERLARVREKNTETRLETMRRVMALPAAKREVRR